MANIKLYKKEVEKQVTAIDWDIKDGIVQLAENADLIDDMLYKAIISPLHPNGYGFGARSLRGRTKTEDVGEAILTLRLYRTLVCLETWYGIELKPEIIDINHESGEIKVFMRIEVSGEIVEVEV